ncbi:hypothetical protein P154DRAFT_612983 [Amniculicola lignicola CBS 123094]|uniref:DUF1772-domain-containing protein n=1 Tax=Amniculicola lignicola CBS 123094 TaxID=1392246 RepID=A0A6A5WAK6_9PLEO|nr:hypothetical protein P154DRAFT_612983 [Amniculicola lignicola CBS 123094]
MADTTTSALQSYSIVAATLAAGFNLSTSLVTIPVLLQSPVGQLASQWQTMFNRGITPVVSLAMTSAVGFMTLAYRVHTASQRLSSGTDVSTRNLYIGAAVATFGLAPYTQILMGGTNSELARRAALQSAQAGTYELVQRWGTFNLWRGVMLLVGAVVGTWATAR